MSRFGKLSFTDIILAIIARFGVYWNGVGWETRGTAHERRIRALEAHITDLEGRMTWLRNQNLADMSDHMTSYHPEAVEENEVVPDHAV